MRPRLGSAPQTWEASERVGDHPYLAQLRVTWVAGRGHRPKQEATAVGVARESPEKPGNIQEGGVLGGC